MSLLRYLTPIFLSLTLNLTYADTNSDNLAKRLDSVQTMRANFIQTIYDNHGKAIQKAYGRMAIQRPGKFRWEVTKSIPQLIIANGSKLWIYDPDLAQVTIRALGQAAGETPALLLSHENAALENEFIIKSLPNKTDGLTWFSLKPKKPDNMFSLIEMGFMNNQIEKMRLTDNLGHQTVIQYQKIESNTALPVSLFTFKPSSKMDVIDETQKK